MLEWKHGEERVGTGAWEWQSGDVSIMTCRGGLGTFFYHFEFLLTTYLIFFPALLKRISDYNMVLCIVMVELRW